MSRREESHNSRHPVLLLGFLSLVFTMCRATAWAEDLYFMAPVRPMASAQFPQSLVVALRPKGFRVSTRSDNEQTVICEIFWARTIAAAGSPRESRKTLYAGLKPGELVGVIHFLIVERYVRDYRSQMLRPGYYTMRYAAMPEGANGSELDFLLLSPVSVDRNPAQTVPLEELVRHGRLASGTRRPAMMSLAEVDTDQTFPSLTTDDEGTCVLQIKLNAKSKKNGHAQELPLALVVVTAIPVDLGD